MGEIHYISGDLSVVELIPDSLAERKDSGVRGRYLNHMFPGAGSQRARRGAGREAIGATGIDMPLAEDGDKTDAASIKTITL